MLQEWFKIFHIFSTLLISSFTLVMLYYHNNNATGNVKHLSKTALWLFICAIAEPINLRRLRKTWTEPWCQVQMWRMASRKSWGSKWYVSSFHRNSTYSKEISGLCPDNLPSHLQWLVCRQPDVRRIQRTVSRLIISSSNKETEVTRRSFTAR